MGPTTVNEFQAYFKTTFVSETVSGWYHSRRDRRDPHIGRCSARRSHGHSNGPKKTRARHVVTTRRGQLMDKVEKKAEARHFWGRSHHNGCDIIAECHKLHKYVLASGQWAARTRASVDISMRNTKRLLHRALTLWQPVKRTLLIHQPFCSTL